MSPTFLLLFLSLLVQIVEAFFLSFYFSLLGQLCSKKVRVKVLLKNGKSEK